MKKFIKGAPVLLLLISSGILLTLVAAVGKSGLYKECEYRILQQPLLSLVFTGIQEEKYPWQIVTGEKSVPAAAVYGEQPEDPVILAEEKTADAITETPSEIKEPGVAGDAGNSGISAPPSASALPQEPPAAVMTKEQAAELEIGYVDENGEIQPFRESTHEEYLNHISADIYGSIGVDRAREYSFTAVDESYFGDALFIGDSRTRGLRDYCDLTEYGDFLCETSLTIYQVMEADIGKQGTVEETLAKQDYGKIYLNVGINELGRGTTENFVSKYKEVVGQLREQAPDAVIFLQGIMRVAKTKNDSDAIFNNNNINARNNAIATLADNEHIFYIDVNEVVCDEEGNLREDYTFDQIHVLGVYNELVKQFIMEHGVK